MPSHTESERLTRKGRIDPRLDARGWPLAPAGAIPLRRPCRTEEEPTAAGPADYALWLDGRIVGLVEAKRVALGSPSDLTQAERYARGLERGHFDFDGLRCPFLYATNGEVLWFRDARHPLNLSRPVADFHAPAALSELLERDYAGACDRLLAMPQTYPRLRPYQKAASAAIEQAIAERKRALLVAMATGTGKTLTLVNQVYRLRLRCADGVLDPLYCALALHHRWQEGYFERVCNNHVSQASVSRAALLQTEIAVPPLPEHHRIVAAVEKRVASATARAEKIPQAILSKAFSGQLVPTEADLARTEGRDYEPAAEFLHRISATRSEGEGTGSRRGRRRAGEGRRTSGVPSEPMLRLLPRESRGPDGRSFWIPAFAGMTTLILAGPSRTEARLEPWRPLRPCGLGLPRQSECMTT